MLTYTKCVKFQHFRKSVKKKCKGCYYVTGHHDKERGYLTSHHDKGRGYMTGHHDKGRGYLTGHHDEGRGHPVMVEDHTLRADKGHVKSHGRRRIHIWKQKLYQSNPIVKIRYISTFWLPG